MGGHIHCGNPQSRSSLAVPWSLPSWLEGSLLRGRAWESCVSPVYWACRSPLQFRASPCAKQLLGLPQTPASADAELPFAHFYGFSPETEAACTAGGDEISLGLSRTHTCNSKGVKIRDASSSPRCCEMNSRRAQTVPGRPACQTRMAAPTMGKSASKHLGLCREQKSTGISPHAAQQSLPPGSWQVSDE